MLLVKVPFLPGRRDTEQTDIESFGDLEPLKLMDLETIKQDFALASLMLLDKAQLLWFNAPSTLCRISTIMILMT